MLKPILWDLSQFITTHEPPSIRVKQGVGEVPAPAQSPKSEDPSVLDPETCRTLSRSLQSPKVPNLRTTKPIPYILCPRHLHFWNPESFSLDPDRSTPRFSSSESEQSPAHCPKPHAR